MNDETQARRLGEWLEGPPGTDPPEDVDTDVLAAVYALRPDRAPAPRVSLDDILGSVKEGPFAAPTAAPAIGFPETAAKGTSSVVPLHATAPPARRQRRFPGWVYPLVGVGFAAAATLALVMPTLTERLSQRASPLLSEAEAPAAPAAAPMPTEAADATTRPDEQQAPKIAEAEPPLTKAKSEEGAAAQGLLAPTRDAGVDALEGAATAGAVAAAPPAPPAPPATTAGPVAPAASAPTVPATESLAAGRATASRPAEPAKAPAGIAEMTAPEAVEVPADAPVAGASWGDEAAPVASKSSSSRSYDDAVAELDVAEEERESRRESKKDAAKPAPAASTTTTATTAVGGGNNGLSDRQRGVPLDYNPSWYTSLPDVVAVYTAAAAQEKLGAWAAAAALYEPLAADARTDVALDASWRAAKARWSAGDASRALTLIDAALRRGGASVHRAHLYVLKGDILAARGQPLEAARAWAAAAAANQPRMDADEAAPAAAPPK